MAKTLNKIEVIGDYKHLQIREITESGSYHRRVFSPNADMSKETQTIQRGIAKDGSPIIKTIKEIAETEWTDEVKSAWTKFQAEQEALNRPN